MRGPLADWDEHASRAVVVALVVIVSRCGVSVDRTGDGTVGSASRIRLFALSDSPVGALTCVLYRAQDDPCEYVYARQLSR